MTVKSVSTLGVVSVYTGILLTKDVTDLYDVIGHVLDYPEIMTHELPAGSHAVSLFLEVEYPWLRSIKFPERDDNYKENLEVLCNSLVSVYSDTLQLWPYYEYTWQDLTGHLQELGEGPESGKRLIKSLTDLSVFKNVLDIK